MATKLLWASLLASATIATPCWSVPADSVRLGDPSLTGGMSGDGPLSITEIKKFLDNPANHSVLSVELPEGLAAGKEAVYIPEDNPLTRAKIELGRQLYFDTRLSGDNTISCASCHSPSAGYGAHTQFGVGVKGQKGNRNSPTSFNRILSKTQFWDGRAGSLEAQAVGPIANPIEMGNTHESVVKFVTSNEGYRIQIEKIFGGAPSIDHVGKAIAAFERTLITGSSPYDFYEPLRKFEEAYSEDLDDLATFEKDEPENFKKYVDLKKKSDANPISESAKRGRELFFSTKSNCSACHVGVNFTDELYHNLGVGMDAAEPDLGRFAQTKVEKDKGAFKTPTLRNIELNGPYMHDGSQKTLEEVVEWYAKGGHPNPYLSDKIKKLELTAEDKADLVEFMKSLTGPLPQVNEGRLPQ
ncbi:MAG: cytochrome c peroxidase [Planctomycetota bacterium]